MFPTAVTRLIETHPLRRQPGAEVPRLSRATASALHESSGRLDVVGAGRYGWREGAMELGDSRESRPGVT